MQIVPILVLKVLHSLKHLFFFFSLADYFVGHHTCFFFARLSSFIKRVFVSILGCIFVAELCIILWMIRHCCWFLTSCYMSIDIPRFCGKCQLCTFQAFDSGHFLFLHKVLQNNQLLGHVLICPFNKAINNVTIQKKYSFQPVESKLSKQNYNQLYHGQTAWWKISYAVKMWQKMLIAKILTAKKLWRKYWICFLIPSVLKKRDLVMHCLQLL